MKKYFARLTAAILALVLLTTPALALTTDQALELLEGLYYYDIPDAAYEADSVEGIIDALGDPYTVYMDEEAYQNFLGQLEGATSTVGIGVSMEYTGEGILVTQILPGGSAELAGLEPGDLIVEVGGTPCVPADETHRELILGEEGTQVTIKVVRDGAERTYTLTRHPVVIPNTQIYMLEGDVGYIECITFGQEAGNDFAQGLYRFDSQVDSWILDLRSNSGGYTDSAVQMLAALNGAGQYLFYEDSQGGVSYDGASAGKPLSTKPLIVLTDGYSASASEVVSAGVRDLNRGVIVGSRTYGKGVAQVMCDEAQYPTYFDGDGLKVTFARFYSAGLNTTDRIGVIPTLLVDDEDTDGVAMALLGDEEDACVALVTRAGKFFVDPDTEEGALAALFQALPPQIAVFYNGIDGIYRQVTPREAAEGMEVSYDSRWFTDLSNSSYAAAINSLASYELLNGMGDGKFEPKGVLTRAQLCAMLTRVLNISYNGPSRFDDVPDTAWYAQAVNAMADFGLVNGMGDGTFDPEGRLTQEQFLAIMGRVARFINVGIDAYGDWLESDEVWLAADQVEALKPFSDWAQNGVSVLAWGLEDALELSGDMLYTRLGNISPRGTVLREDAAAGMYTVLHGLGILP